MEVKQSELNNLRLAVLIDADNAPRNCLKGVMEEVAIYGTPTIKRIYGDWTSPTIGGWKNSLLENAITPIQQYGYTTGKNSTDSAMIIDAMDILYEGKTDGFVIVSSDSDFTRLVIRLREAGQKVIGIGEKKTPDPFIVACDKFIYIENIRAHYTLTQELGHESEEDELSRISEKKVPRPQKKQDTRGVTKRTITLIAESIADIADDEGYAYLGELGNLLLKKQPDFDARNYGFAKLTPLIKSLPRFELDVRQTTDEKIKHMYVRDREA